MNWEQYRNGFKSYLALERALSNNSVQAYLTDLDKLIQFIEFNKPNLSFKELVYPDLQDFIKWINELGISRASQARIISGIKAFFKYLLIEDFIQKNPSDLLEVPKINRKIPDILSLEEINELINMIDLSREGAERNKCMLETLYSCGLRVSELISLQISNLFFKEGFIRIIGKGDKERLVPIGSVAIKQIEQYLKLVRIQIPVKIGYEDFVFLNRRGKSLSRVMVFKLIKDLAEKCGINKKISPHTFRHSFATHLIDAGANLIAVQQMLGHESITTTEIYTHLDKEYLREAIESYHPRYNKET